VNKSTKQIASRIKHARAYPHLAASTEVVVVVCCFRLQVDASSAREACMTEMTLGRLHLLYLMTT
jgi:hypothetical protein